MNSSELSEIIGGKKKNDNTMIIIVVIILCCCCYCCSISSGIGAYFMMNKSNTDGTAGGDVDENGGGSGTGDGGSGGGDGGSGGTGTGNGGSGGGNGNGSATGTGSITAASSDADPKCTKVGESYLCLGVENDVPVCYGNNNGCNWNTKTSSGCSNICSNVTSDTSKYQGMSGTTTDKCTEVLRTASSDSNLGNNWVYQACKLTTPD